jgi:heat shock protein HspQ
MSKFVSAKFGIGQVIRHRIYGLRGMVFDVDAEFIDSELTRETVLNEARSFKDQPFYYLFAADEDHAYVAYVSEHDLLADCSGEPVHHPQVEANFERDGAGLYRWRGLKLH